MYSCAQHVTGVSFWGVHKARYFLLAELGRAAAGNEGPHEASDLPLAGSSIALGMLAQTPD